MDTFPETQLITSAAQLPPVLAASVSTEERVLIEKFEIQGFPFAVTPHFASLAGPEREDPVRRQFMPDPLEESVDPFALDDPLGEEQYRLAPRLVHQYQDRALLLAGGSCAGFCRYCFRRHRMPGFRKPDLRNSRPEKEAAFISTEELERVLACLETRPAIREILVSGGDPLTAGDDTLEELFVKLRKARPDLHIRLCSRIPITNPARLTPETISLLARFKPIRIATHINHPRELDGAARTVLAAAAEAGIPVLVQTVLLRGINDNAETLASLFRECLSLGISPYYLFQLDLAPGTAHFRVPLKDGLAVYRDLEHLFDGPGLPAYALDLPGGGGKIHLNESVITGEEDSPRGRVYLLKDKDKKLWKYPVDKCVANYAL